LVNDFQIHGSQEDFDSRNNALQELLAHLPGHGQSEMYRARFAKYDLGTVFEMLEFETSDLGNRHAIVELELQKGLEGC
jgi:hypothetical protein